MSVPTPSDKKSIISLLWSVLCAVHFYNWAVFSIKSETFHSLEAVSLYLECWDYLYERRGKLLSLLSGQCDVISGLHWPPNILAIPTPTRTNVSSPDITQHTCCIINGLKLWWNEMDRITNHSLVCLLSVYQICVINVTPLSHSTRSISSLFGLLANLLWNSQQNYLRILLELQPSYEYLITSLQWTEWGMMYRAEPNTTLHYSSISLLFSRHTNLTD